MHEGLLVSDICCVRLTAQKRHSFTDTVHGEALPAFAFKFIIRNVAADDDIVVGAAAADDTAVAPALACTPSKECSGA
jgi:hypothetical protein